MKYFVLILFSLVSTISFGQGKSASAKSSDKMSKKTVLGIQISPMIPSNFLQQNDYYHESDSINYSIINRASLSYGVEIKHFFTYRFALSTGIFYTKRNIDVSYSSYYDRDYYNVTGVDTSFDRELKFIAFEIPIKASGYVRLSQQIFMNINGGININFYPSDIRVDNVYMQRIGTKIGSKSYQFFQLGYSAGIGWEFRTKDSGTFYLGSTYQARIDNMASILMFEEETLHRADYFHNLKGGYLTIDIKYFFPLNEKARH